MRSPAFTTTIPGVEVTVGEENSDRLVHRLRRGELDFAFVEVAAEVPAGLELRAVADEELLAAVAADHPLARAEACPSRPWPGCP